MEFDYSKAPKHGIDVSLYQGNIDFNDVKDSGIDFVIIRAMHRNFTVDAKFEQNYKRATACGLQVGVYMPSFAMSYLDAIYDADHLLKLLNGRHLDFPIYYDMEASSQIRLGKKNLAAIARAFIREIKNNSLYNAGVYLGAKWVREDIIDLEDLELDTPYWLAKYPLNDNSYPANKRPYNQVYGNYWMWQYTSKGRVNGIGGDVDMDVLYCKAETNKPTTVNGKWVYDKEKDTWRYLKSANKYATSEWLFINKHWYYFGEDTIMKTGFQEIKGKWYYLMETGDYTGACMKTDEYGHMDYLTE